MTSCEFYCQGERVEVTKKMLDAGYEEVLKVADQKGLRWALKWFPRSFIDAILTEGYIKMYHASQE
jgi:hypothetical protein